MNELGKGTTIIPPITDIYNVHDRFYERSKKGTVHSVITTTFYPHFPKLLHELLPKNIHANVIVSCELFDKLRTEHRTEIVKFLDNELIHLFVYPKNMGLLSFLYNEYCIMLSPLTNKGDFDNKHIEYCNQGARNWGKELFEHYLNESRPITEL
ncbi:helix-turn-helix transcriptional regulator [Methanolobus halotolerans]|uniref:Methanogenesis regulatory protein FilR1 middle domain-containing protein n=1 Tax=Methanolobus halotolerans TaxID=2052935 RepID=A0A4E0PVQ5_9EURY|nr:transcriptional regulator FilR1 domain-containing protein [Methanolobus halotolerans]TGC09438.1 hypothetical protein CUN85_06310 [Methanolobus halotolerans]